MLPLFPKFKRLECSDREDIEKITSQYPPYSDFDFVSMWSWDINGEMRISQSNGNLVVRFDDYITGELFYSFLGSNKPDETAKALLDLSVKGGLKAKLKLVPETTAKELNSEIFEVEEDRANFDYIISVERLMPHDGTVRRLSSRRHLIKKFKEANNFELAEIDVYDSAIQDKINEVFVRWEAHHADETNNPEHLRLALNRLFQINNCKGIKAFGAFIDNELVGYSINGLCSNGYAVGHFQQGNVEIFKGIYALLMHEAAPFFQNLGCEFINLEQDLDVPGLRSWKSSCQPITFLKKFEVCPKD